MSLLSIPVTLAPVETFCCALSGGADSVALLYLLREYVKERPIQLVAIHCNHHLRDTAARDQHFCIDLCRRWGILLHVAHIDVPQHRKPNESVESAARRLRYDAFARYVKNYSHPVLMTAHHADDLLENLWIRLSRGANLSGAMAPEVLSRFGTMTVCRPLLHASKKTILQMMQDFHLSYVEDETNANPQLGFRNFLRNEVLPSVYEHFPHAHLGMLQSLNCLEADKNFIESQAAIAYRSICDSQGLKCAEFHALHPALRYRVLRDFIYAKVPTFPLTQGIMAQLEQRLQNLSVHPQKLSLTQGLFLRIMRSYITLECEDAPMAPCAWDFRIHSHFSWGDYHFEASRITVSDISELSTDSFCFCFPEDESLTLLQVQTYAQGMTMLPFGATHPVALRKIFINAHVSAHERTRYPIFCNAENQTVLWIPGIRRSSQFSVTHFSFPIWKISCRYTPPEPNFLFRDTIPVFSE